LADRAEAERGVLPKLLDGKALFTGLMRLYAAIYREMVEQSSKVLHTMASKNRSEVSGADIRGRHSKTARRSGFILLEDNLDRGVT
jgi:hypothetical protein